LFFLLANHGFVKTHKLTEEDNVDDEDDKIEPTGKSNTTCRGRTSMGIVDSNLNPYGKCKNAKPS
jgi:hypothetical protein